MGIPNFMKTARQKERLKDRMTHRQTQFPMISMSLMGPQMFYINKILVQNFSLPFQISQI